MSFMHLAIRVISRFARNKLERLSVHSIREHGEGAGLEVERKETRERVAHEERLADDVVA